MRRLLRRVAGRISDERWEVLFKSPRQCLFNLQMCIRERSGGQTHDFRFLKVLKIEAPTPET